MKVVNYLGLVGFSYYLTLVIVLWINYPSRFHWYVTSLMMDILGVTMAIQLVWKSNRSNIQKGF